MSVYYFDFSGTITKDSYTKKDILRDSIKSRKILREKYLISKTFKLVKKLKDKGETLGIITNTKCTSKQMDKILKKLGIKSYFKNVIVSCNIKRNPSCTFRKPYREIFDYAKSLHPRAKKFFYYGNDYNLDIKAPKKLGWNTNLIKE